jgi:hypothetical protein
MKFFPMESSFSDLKAMTVLSVKYMLTITDMTTESASLSSKKGHKTMKLKEEIRKAAEEFRTVETVEIATLKPGVVIVWINGVRFGNYDINEHRFTALMA